MTHQFQLFSARDMAPRPQLKKIITRERMEEVRKLIDSGQMSIAARQLADLNDSLEQIEKRLTNKRK